MTVWLVWIAFCLLVLADWWLWASLNKAREDAMFWQAEANMWRKVAEDIQRSVEQDSGDV